MNDVNAKKVEAAADHLADEVAQLLGWVPETAPGVRLVLQHAQHALIAAANHTAAFGLGDGT